MTAYGLSAGERKRINSPSEAHLNGFKPEEATALGLSNTIEQRTAAATKLLEAVERDYPDEVSALTRLLNLDVQLVTLAARRGLPISSSVLLDVHRVLHGSVDPKHQTPDHIQRRMEQAAQRRLSLLRLHDLQGSLTPEEIYSMCGVDVTARVPRAGLYVSFDRDFVGYEGVSGMERPLSHIVGDFAELTQNGSLAQEMEGCIGPEARYLRTPALMGADDGHFVAAKDPFRGGNNAYGIQFDDQCLLAALSLAVSRDPQAFSRIPLQNERIYKTVAQASRQYV